MIGDVPTKAAVNEKPEEFEYYGFISYSRGDNKEPGREWATWIKKKLESFRVPESCVGRSTNLGAVPERLGKVFLDRNDLSAEGTLNDALIEKIKRSRFLLLLCSPRSAESKYVGLEIEHFIQYHGPQRIIRIVIAGEQPPGKPKPKVLNDALLAAKAGEVSETAAGADYLRVDFRVKEDTPGDTRYMRDGWVEPRHYARQLAKEKNFGKKKRDALVRAYEKEHEIQYYALLATLLGLPPREIQEDDKRERLKQQRAKRIVSSSITGVAILCTVLIAVFSVQTNRARKKAERSLMMIGDAHESTARLVADVLVDLRAKLGAETNLLDDAQKIVDAHLTESEPTGQDDDSLHMRSVVLNSRGYLARQLGRFDEAEKQYAEALAIRRELANRNPKEPMYDHNVSVSLDNFGDLHAQKGENIAWQGGDKRDEYGKALDSYRAGLEIAKRLAARPDATAQWRHDLVVSRLKVGATLFQGGDMDGALAELQRGLSEAEAVASSDAAYSKWQAHLGLFCLEIGRIHATRLRFDDAKPVLQRGQAIFRALVERNPLSSEYARRLAQIESVLRDASE